MLQHNKMKNIFNDYNKSGERKKKGTLSELFKELKEEKEELKAEKKERIRERSKEDVK